MRMAAQEEERMDGEEETDRDRDGDGDILGWWEDKIECVTLGMEPNDPLDYAPVLELYHPIMSTLVDPGFQLERN